MYHPHHIHLSRAQGQKLLKGGRVSLKHHELAGSSSPGVGKHRVGVHLTPRQAQRVGTALSKGLGSTIMFDHKQRAHHARHGGGFWGDLAMGVARTAGNAALSHLKHHSHGGVRAVAHLGQAAIPAGQAIYQAVQEHKAAKRMADAARAEELKAEHDVVAAQGSGLFGSDGLGMGIRRGGRRRRGAGFWSGALRTVNGVGEMVGLGVRRRVVRRRRTGSGAFAKGVTGIARGVGTMLGFGVRRRRRSGGAIRRVL